MVEKDDSYRRIETLPSADEKLDIAPLIRKPKPTLKEMLERLKAIKS